MAWTPTIIMKYYKDLLEHPGRTARNLSSLRTGILAAGMLSTEPIALPRPVQGSSQSRGENVDPTEVEGLLLEDPRINHVAVVGLPDEWLAEVPVALVIKEAGAVLTEQDVLECRRNCIARFKIPPRLLRRRLPHDGEREDSEVPASRASSERSERVSAWGVLFHLVYR